MDLCSRASSICLILLSCARFPRLQAARCRLARQRMPPNELPAGLSASQSGGASRGSTQWSRVQNLRAKICDITTDVEEAFAQRPSRAPVGVAPNSAIDQGTKRTVRRTVGVVVTDAANLPHVGKRDARSARGVSWKVANQHRFHKWLPAPRFRGFKQPLVSDSRVPSYFQVQEVRAKSWESFFHTTTSAFVLPPGS
jgi:hypothetical protein